MDCPHQLFLRDVDARNLILKNLLDRAVVRGHSLDIVGVLVLFFLSDRAENSSGRAPICNWIYLPLF